MLPDVDDKHLTRRKCKQSALALKVLVLATLTPIRTFNVHHQDVVCHARFLVRASLALLLIVRQPDTLGRLPALELGHDGELRAKEVVEQGGLAGRLGAKHGDEMVVEAGRGDILEREVFG